MAGVGTKLASVDVNGDGFDDVIMQDATINAYSVRVVFGHGGAFDAQLNLAQMDLSRGLRIDGTDGGEVLVGGRGNDLLDGRGGSDSLIGGANNDTLRCAWQAMPATPSRSRRRAGRRLPTEALMETATTPVCTVVRPC